MIQKRSKCFFASSLLVLIFAVILASWGIPLIFRKEIKKNIQLDESSLMFEKWKNMPVPLKFKVYVFNVTNPEEVNQGEKPKLAEIGPFVYDEFREKIVLGYGDKDIIRYNLKKTFIFNQAETGDLSLDDEVTVINFSYLGAILTVQGMMPGALPMINGALEIFFEDLKDPFLRVKVRNLFFDGIFLNCNGTNTALSLLCGKIKADAPSVMRPAEDRKGFYFSMFNHLNQSLTGPFEVKRGTEDINDLGKIITYKNKTSMEVWEDEYCGKMNGTDASIYPPFFGEKFPERLYAYEPEICRSIYATLVGTRKVFNITSVYYEISESVLAAKSANPENKCFCKRDWSLNHDGCLLMGVLNLEPCQGAPAIVSLPHFYLASEELLEYVEEGLLPDKEKHNTFVYLDATTGIVLWGVRRMQFNIELRNIKNIPQLQNVSTGLFPMLWIEEGAKIPEDLVAELRYSHKMLSFADMFRWILLAIGITTTLISCFILMKSGSVPLPWQRHSNTVSFVMGDNTNGGSKMHM